MKLAIDGGTPVREAAPRMLYPGCSVYDEKEANEILKVAMARSPFRYYGYEPQHMADNFENAVKERFNIKNALGVTSGTAAVIVALKAAGIGPGDKVIVPACTFVATAGAVICAGAVPIFADVDDNLNINPDEIGRLADKYTKAVIAVPMAGNPCPMDRVVEEAKKYNLIVIEDVAQSMGSSLNGKPMGTWGDIGTFSFQLNKVLTTGEGGLVITNNDDYYERAVRYHDQGSFRKAGAKISTDVSRVLIGQNYRMSELTAAAAGIQLGKLDDIMIRMRAIKKQIKAGISDIKGIRFREILDKNGDAGTTIVMFLPDKEKTKRFVSALRAEKIPCGDMYEGTPVYMNPQIFYKKTIDTNGFPYNQFDEEIIYTEDMCPNAISIIPTIATLGVTPVLSQQDIDDIITAVRKVAAAVL